MKITRLWKTMVWPAVPVCLVTGVLLAATLAGCGGSAVTGNGTTYVTVTIGEGGSSAAAPATAASRATPRPLAAAIPSTVTAIRFTISGADIDDVVETFPVTGATMTVTLQVPTGPARTITVEALDSVGTPRYQGATVIDATGVALAVTITMVVDPSNPALLVWSARANTISTTAALNSLAQGDGTVLAAGTSGEILSSANGVSWISRTSGAINGDISKLAFGDNTFLALVPVWNFSAAPPCTNYFYRAASDDVATWTPTGIIGPTTFEIADLAFGAGTFVAVGSESAFYSTDKGATWSPGTISGMQGLSAVAYGNGRFAAVGYADDNVAVSADGILWTTVSMGLTGPPPIERIGFGGGLFLVATSDGNVYTSADGTTWQQRTQIDLTGIGEPYVSSISYGAGAFLVIVSNTSVFFTFDSGVTWSGAIDPGGYVYDGTYWNGAFITVGSTGPGTVFRSGDL